MGGLLSPPFFVEDREEPYRPGLIAWVDVTSALVVGQDVVAPEDAPGAVGRALLAAIDEPLAGAPARPDRIRVASAALADEVRAALGDSTPVRVAPTPELDELVDAMVESLAETHGDWSYLEGGGVSAERVAELFRAADRLHRRAPWKIVTDEYAIRMDIPALGVEGACVLVLGAAGTTAPGMNDGLMILPSIDAFDAFAESHERATAIGAGLDFGTDWMTLQFARGADLPPALRREVAQHGWPVAKASAYPVLERFERDGASCPLDERDLRIASACATALDAFVGRNRKQLRGDVYEEPISSTISIPGDVAELDVCLTVPYEAFEEFDVAYPSGAPGGSPAVPPAQLLAQPLAQRPTQPPTQLPTQPPARPKVGRNDACPCGSGRKYKKCHMAEDEARHDAESGTARKAAQMHELDDRLLHDIGGFAQDHVGEAAFGFAKDFFDLEEAAQLAIPWSAFHFEIDGKPLVDWFLEERGRRLSSAERAWLEAQRAAWLSVWEVIDIDPGRSITLRDLLSHEERVVHEESGSETLVVRDALLARVVDCDGLSLLCGVHPMRLPPISASEVVHRARGRLRRKRAVPIERLRDEKFGRYLVKRWEEAVAGLRHRAAHPPGLRNTEGHEVLATTDHFALERGARASVAARLARLEGVELDEPDEPGDESAPLSFVFMAPANGAPARMRDVVLGEARLYDTRVEVETNSVERADALRARVESACAGLLRHRAREHSDPMAPPVQEAARERASHETDTPPPEARQMLLDFKRRHYATWPDEPLPALLGKTPRAAVRTVSGRQNVDALLKDMEHQERHFEGTDAFDFGPLRRELGLD